MLVTRWTLHHSLWQPLKSEPEQCGTVVQSGDSVRSPWWGHCKRFTCEIQTVTSPSVCFCIKPVNSTNFISIPVELGLHVTGVVGDLVPSPRIFLAGGTPGSLDLRFLLLPGICLSSEVFSGVSAGAGVGVTRAGVATGTGGGTTASQHWHTLCNSGRRSWRKETASGFKVFCFISLLTHDRKLPTKFTPRTSLIVGWAQIHSCLWAEPCVRGLQRKVTGPRGCVGYCPTL